MENIISQIISILNDVRWKNLKHAKALTTETSEQKRLEIIYVDFQTFYISSIHRMIM